MVTIVPGEMLYPVSLKGGCFLYIHDMWIKIRNMLATYADYTVMLEAVPYFNMRSVISDSLNRYLAEICEWCRLWVMIMNLKKSESVIVRRPMTLLSQHSDLFIESVSLNTNDSWSYF